MVHVAFNRGLLRTITVLLTFQVLTIILVLVSAANVGGQAAFRQHTGQQGTPEAGRVVKKTVASVYKNSLLLGLCQSVMGRELT
jgi:hypothetical protein